jgi:hypothetical protein
MLRIPDVVHSIEAIALSSVSFDRQLHAARQVLGEFADESRRFHAEVSRRADFDARVVRDVEKMQRALHVLLDDEMSTQLDSPVVELLDRLLDPLQQA